MAVGAADHRESAVFEVSASGKFTRVRHAQGDRGTRGRDHGNANWR